MDEVEELKNKIKELEDELNLLKREKIIWIFKYKDTYIASKYELPDYVPFKYYEIFNDNNMIYNCLYLGDNKCVKFFIDKSIIFVKYNGKIMHNGFDDTFIMEVFETDVECIHLYVKEKWCNKIIKNSDYKNFTDLL